MALVATGFITCNELEKLQLLKGCVVFSKNVVRDFFARLKTIIGGELKGYTEHLNDARRIATERMIGEAMTMGAAADVTVYGTTVKFK